MGVSGMMMTFVLQWVSEVSSPTQIVLHIFLSPADLIPTQFPHDYEVGSAHTVKNTHAYPNAGLTVAHMCDPYSQEAQNIKMSADKSTQKFFLTSLPGRISPLAAPSFV